MQTNIFEIMMPQYKIKNPIRLIELFGGVGSQAKALTNLGVNFEHYKLTVNQIAENFEVSVWTVKKYLKKHEGKMGLC